MTWQTLTNFNLTNEWQMSDTFTPNVIKLLSSLSSEPNSYYGWEGLIAWANFEGGSSEFINIKKFYPRPDEIIYSFKPPNIYSEWRLALKGPNINTGGIIWTVEVEEWDTPFFNLNSASSGVEHLTCSLTSGANVTHGTTVVLDFNHALEFSSNLIDFGTKEIQESGTYHIICSCNIGPFGINSAKTNILRLHCLVNDVIINTGYYVGRDTSWSLRSVRVNKIVTLQAGDTLKFQLYFTATTGGITVTVLGQDSGVDRSELSLIKIK